MPSRLRERSISRATAPALRNDTIPLPYRPTAVWIVPISSQARIRSTAGPFASKYRQARSSAASDASSRK